MKSFILLAVTCVLWFSNYTVDTMGNVSITVVHLLNFDVQLPKPVNKVTAQYIEIQKDIKKSLFLEQ